MPKTTYRRDKMTTDYGTAAKADVSESPAQPAPRYTPKVNTVAEIVSAFANRVVVEELGFGLTDDEQLAIQFAVYHVCNSAAANRRE